MKRVILWLLLASCAQAQPSPQLTSKQRSEMEELRQKPQSDWRQGQVHGQDPGGALVESGPGAYRQSATSHSDRLF